VNVFFVRCLGSAIYVGLGELAGPSGRRKNKKGRPPVADGPEALTRFVLLFDPSLKNTQEKLDTICQNLPEAAEASAEAEEGQRE
jgi:hypothetical protein